MPNHQCCPRLPQDEQRSQLNALLVEKIQQGALKHINLFAPGRKCFQLKVLCLRTSSCVQNRETKEVNNVCDHGPDLLKAMRLNLARAVAIREAVPVVI